MKKLRDKWVAEGNVTPEWAVGLHVRYKLVSTVCVPLKVLDDGGAQALLLVQATSKRRDDGKFRSSNVGRCPLATDDV